MLERFGLGADASTPSIAPSPAASSASRPRIRQHARGAGRGGHFRGSWFRRATSCSTPRFRRREKRAAKSVIDVGIRSPRRRGRRRAGSAGARRRDRRRSPPPILSLAMVSSVGATIVAASQLNRWYVSTSRRACSARGGDLAVSRRADDSLRRRLLGLRRTRHMFATPTPTRRRVPARGERRTVAGRPTRSARHLALRPGEPRAIEVLSRERGLTAQLIPHAIPLLAANRWPIMRCSPSARSRKSTWASWATPCSTSEPTSPPPPRSVFAVCCSQRAAGVLWRAGRQRGSTCGFRRPGRWLRSATRTRASGSMGSGSTRWSWRRSASLGPCGRAPKKSLAHVFTLLSLVLARDRFRSPTTAWGPRTVGCAAPPSSTSGRARPSRRRCPSAAVAAPRTPVPDASARAGRSRRGG